MNEYLEKLITLNPLREVLIENIINNLKLSAGSKGVDVGCGYGAQCLLLADAVGVQGKVTGVDIEPEFLKYGNKLIVNNNLSERINFEIGDKNKLPFPENTFDWAWSMDCIAYHPSDPTPAIKELKRVVKPGGMIFVLAWSSEMLLPGYPVLEAKLRATSVGIAPFSKSKNPKNHFLRMLNRLTDHGFLECSVQTFVRDVFAPLNKEIKKAMIELLEMRWQGVESELSKKDLIEFQKICKPESPQFILNLPDYYAFFTYSLFKGKVKK